jgi:hypothetical protein
MQGHHSGSRLEGKPTRTHDGQVVTLRSDLRWCSDSFEIRCWNGERVQVAFLPGQAPTARPSSNLLSNPAADWRVTCRSKRGS